MRLRQKMIKTGTASLLTAAVLVIASLASIQIIPSYNNAAAAAGNIVFKEQFRGGIAQVQATTTEGSITTTALVTALMNPSRICVYMPITDSNTGDLLSAFYGCGPADQLSINSGLNSATFSGTITLVDDITLTEEKTVTVNADLTGTGKVQTQNFGIHQVTQDFTFITNAHGQFRPASGSLTITDTNTGDVIISADDATGIIGKSRSGTIEVIRG